MRPVDSPEGRKYIAAMRAAANFGFCNRQLLMQQARDVFASVFGRSWEDLGMELLYDVAHNIAKLEDHTVDVAHSGAEALARAPLFRPEVILCDIGLPGMNGYEVVRRFREHESLRDTVLVALTGYTSEADKKLATQAGFDFHIAKPPSVERLREILAQLA